MTEEKIKKALAWLIFISILIRIFLSWTLELGNDEVYYWTYAMYPDLSHFDHPPMVGWIIQLFSFNLFFESELFLRLGSLIFGSLNCLLMFYIGKEIKDSLTGLYAALLYTTSVYGFIITGIFILPDTPQMFFWLLAVFFAIKSSSVTQIDRISKRNMILTGLFTGFGMLSKYTSIFIWTGVISYICLFNRKWLKSKWLYLSFFITLLIFSPVIYWNIKNNFISFSFQSERVNLFTSSLRVDYFIMEILGEFLYNNPVNFILIIISLIAIFKKRVELSLNHARLILLISLPMIIIFIIFSLFRRTLPHWTAPGYTTLLIIAAVFLRNKNIGEKFIPAPIKAAGLLLVIVVLIGFLQVNYGLVRFSNPVKTDPIELGKYDLSLEVFGWKQIGKGFTKVLNRDKEKKKLNDDAVIITYRWFPAANLDYYAGRPNQIKTLAIGSINDIHKYYWINQYRGGFFYGMDAYFITTSYDYADPCYIFSDFFEIIEVTDTIRINRAGSHVMNAFIYRMENMKKLPVIKR
jgi:4-amino-4-deoxy-L-arabinose transferase-like glycosyltransferase